MKYLDSYYKFYEGVESLGDVKTLMNYMSDIKEILNTADNLKIDSLIQKIGGINKLFEVFNGAVESMQSGFAKATISSLFSKNPQPLKKVNIDSICNYLTSKYKASTDSVNGFKNSIYAFAKSFNIPIN